MTWLAPVCSWGELIRALNLQMGLQIRTTDGCAPCLSEDRGLELVDYVERAMYVQGQKANALAEGTPGCLFT